MTVLYRAIWNDDRPNLIADAFSAFRAWIAEKSEGQLAVPDSGDAAGVSISRDRAEDGRWFSVSRPAEVKVDRVDPRLDGRVIEALRATFIETPDDGSRWSTTLRAWECVSPEDQRTGEGAGWLWVDVEAVTSTPFAEPITVAPPRLVRTLVMSGTNPRRRCVPLTTYARRYSGEDDAEQLAAMLSHTDRDMPVVVFSDDVRTRPPDALPQAPFEEIVRVAAHHTLGLAAVAVVDGAACTALGEILGRAHSVWGGAFRTYLPGLDPATNHDEWRHRYVPADRYMRYRETAARLITSAVRTTAATRRAPGSFAEAKQLLDDTRRADIAELTDDLARAEEEAAQHRTQIALLEGHYINLLTEHELLLDDRARLLDRVDQLQRQVKRASATLAQAGNVAHFWDQEMPEEVAPTIVATPSDAALSAQIYLSDHVDLPEEACVDLEDLDAAPEARSWGQTSWEAFRALHAYAVDLANGRSGGNFWTWCENSGNPLVWRATPKKLAMTESETVERNDDLRRRRVLPVSTKVDPSGRCYMPAHIKIAEGGGSLAPRIYFHVSRKTGMVHVGFFGPHKHMPNSRT